MKAFCWLPIGFLLLLMASCQDAPLYQEQHRLPASGWTYADSLVFEFTIDDTARFYDLLLEIEHSPTFPYQNFYTDLRTTFPNGNQRKSQVSFQLMDAQQGLWYGRCDARNCRVPLSLQQHTYFDQLGTYRLVIRQHSRRDTLMGITAIELQLKPD